MVRGTYCRGVQGDDRRRSTRGVFFFCRNSFYPAMGVWQMFFYSRVHRQGDLRPPGHRRGPAAGHRKRIGGAPWRGGRAGLRPHQGQVQEGARVQDGQRGLSGDVSLSLTIRLAICVGGDGLAFSAAVLCGLPEFECLSFFRNTSKPRVSRLQWEADPRFLSEGVRLLEGVLVTRCRSGNSPAGSRSTCCGRSSGPGTPWCSCCPRSCRRRSRWRTGLR